MEMYPRLRDEVEMQVSKYIRETEQATKTQISQIIDFQLAYINTNHENFEGYSKLVRD